MIDLGTQSRECLCMADKICIHPVLSEKEEVCLVSKMNGNQNAAKPDSEKRTERLVIRVTKVEKSELRKRAALAKNVSEYARGFLFQ